MTRVAVGALDPLATFTRKPCELRRVASQPFHGLHDLAGVAGGDVPNKVPERCTIDVDIRYLPNQDPGDILAQIRTIGDLEVVKVFQRVPAIVSRSNPYVLALRDAVGRNVEGDALSIGRDGASDAVSFLEAGIPAVEFGPVGGGPVAHEDGLDLRAQGAEVLDPHRRPALEDLLAVGE